LDGAFATASLKLRVGKVGGNDEVGEENGTRREPEPLRCLHFMENIGENQGTSRKITAFFPDVNVFPTSADALERSQGLKRTRRRRRNVERGERGEIGKTGGNVGTREMGKRRKIEKDRSSERTVCNGANANRRRRNRGENGVDERLLAV